MWLPLWMLPSIFFGKAEFAVNLVLLLCEHKQHDHEHDERALCGHVEAERETKNRNDDIVERLHEHVDDEAEEEPDGEMREHQARGLRPVCFFFCSQICGVRHGSQISLKTTGQHVHRD